jgi:hypothetical protein
MGCESCSVTLQVCVCVCFSVCMYVCMHACIYVLKIISDNVYTCILVMVLIQQVSLYQFFGFA